MDAASGVVSVSVAPVYNAADFVCALSQRRMKNTGAIDPGCALERSKLPTLKRSFYDEMAACCRCLDATLTALRLHRIRKPCTTAFVLSAMQVRYQRHRSRVSRKPRPGLEQGTQMPVRHETRVYKAMPPRGLCMDCSVEDYRPIIHRMNE